MEVIAALLVIAVLAVVVAVVGAPLRRGAPTLDEGAAVGRLPDLQAARDAKYQEIREAELDVRTGKLEEGDFRSLDRRLRTEAVAILRELDELESG